jgi:hypothetical protein
MPQYRIYKETRLTGNSEITNYILQKKVLIWWFYVTAPFVRTCFKSGFEIRKEYVIYNNFESVKFVYNWIKKSSYKEIYKGNKIISALCDNYDYSRKMCEFHINISKLDYNDNYCDGSVSLQRVKQEIDRSEIKITNSIIEL